MVVLIAKEGGADRCAVDQMMWGSSVKDAGAIPQTDIDTEFVISAAVMDRGVPGTDYVR